MRKRKTIHRLMLIATVCTMAGLINSESALCSGHGPVFGFTTPTNSRGGWTLDLSAMGRAGGGQNGSMLRSMLSYGITEDIQVSFTTPYVLSSAPLAPIRGTSMMATTPDIEAIGAWRFQRRGTDIGKRIESTAYAGLIVPGPQQPPGMLGSLKRALGSYTAVATGLASRSHYLWGGAGFTTFAQNDGDRRPNVLSYSLVWGYRPPILRKDYPDWDWRLFAEMSGDKSGKIHKAGIPMPGTDGHEIFAGPTVLGIYKNYAIEGGLQFPVYQELGANFQREKFRYAINFSYFF